ncbi:hypothetical protein C8A00DRAFT_33070 [Chaetomidium leptoderma]|uniref:Helicase ATP-binding domain-containing protein n=1 Tax=Chaetomidium leptoderma TaxID=669021 RepID=A0AAN6ZXS5_9PEZI|nr:hypothetical protein C8A00DRAFT_33070 [Chaetomidium leptoderma]
MAPRKNAKAPRAATSKHKNRAPSAPSAEYLPAGGKRKRSANHPTKASNQDGDGDSDGGRRSLRSGKKQKASPSAGGEDDQSQPVDSDSSSSSVIEVMGVDPPAGNGNAGGMPDKKPKRFIDTSLLPISDVRLMFEDMVARLNPMALKESPIKLNVATLCSGTDAPIFALGLIQDALQATGFGAGFEFEHLFSCEIEPFKQGFIRRNLPHGTLIFRDVVELASVPNKATTAGGSKAAIPAEKLDILFAGCSCVDYSLMNQNKPSGRVPSLDRFLKQKPKKKKKTRAKKKLPDEEEDDDEELPPVKLDEDFVYALDPGLEELLRLPSGGESARTFFAAVKLITNIRPKLVMLENVVGAPWDMYTDLIFPRVCYVARRIKLDSKEFYLPQTRQRGYLVAVDAQSIGLEKATAIAEAWMVQLTKCKRPPSSSISAFLRPTDDPGAIQARADMESKTSYNAEWALCLLRHADVRQKNGIRRDDNPFSMKAMRSGRLISTVFPSHSWLPFWGSQPARVIDLMDIVFAVARKQGVDLGYKTGMIDVSQNVDRNKFVVAARANRTKNNLGIVGCITPSGMPIVTDLMRPITGTETLALQGLPVDELVISTETQAQLRDLAGNAMTVTVVGAATLALLLAVLRSDSTTDSKLLNHIESARPRRSLYLEAPPDHLLVPGRVGSATLDTQPLLAIAKEMVRLCYCAARANGVFACNACGITACSACRGNPKHSFGIKKATGLESSAEQGKVRLRNLLPNALMLPVPPSITRHALSMVEEEELYHSVVSDVLTEGVMYYFDEIKVTETVVVCYKAANTIARLVLSPDSACRWYIYIAPWHPAHIQLSGTFDLNQPIARGHLSPEDPSIVDWAVWIPGHINLTLQLAKNAAGALVTDKLSFEAGYKMAPDASLLAWKKLVEEEVCGTYFHHPDCGTAGNALHIKQSATTAAAKVFMMWDSARLRDPSDDHFVWTKTMRRMEPHEYRETLLHAKPTLTWNLDSDSDLGQVSVFWLGYWSSPASYPNTPKPSLPVRIQDLVQLHWGSTEAIQQASCHVPHGQAPITRMPILAAITATLGGFPVSAARLSKMDARQTNDRFYIIPATGLEAFLRMFASLSGELRQSTTPGDVALFPHLHGKWVRVALCRDCSVTPPKITVYSKEDRRTTSRGATRSFKAIIEDPDEAALFERHYQDLPRAVAVAAQLVHGDGDGEASIMDMRLMLQPKTLASRAFGYLLQAHHTAARGRSALNLTAETSFTVVLDHAASSIAVFAPLSDSVQPCSDKHTIGIDLSRPCELPDSPPARFSREIKKGRGKKAKTTLVQYELRPSQKEAVNWMLQRERAPLDFVKSEIEEEVVAPLNLRVVGKAEWATSFPYSSRGGVVAHEVGYGKTVVTLALLDHMQEFDKKESIAERMEKADGVWSEELPRPFGQFGYPSLIDPNLKAKSFFHHLSATLVIVPRHITSQWENESKKFLGLTGAKLLVIKSVDGFYNKRALERLQEAEIIIVSSAVFGQAFLNRLQTVAGRDKDYHKGLHGRTLEAWYRGALRNHRILTAYYLAGRAADISHDDLMQTLLEDLLPRLIRKQQAEIDALLEKQVPEIDRRLYKKAGKEAGKSAAATSSGNKQGGAGKLPAEKTDKAEKGGDNKGEGEATKKGEKDWDICWLHNCSFARVIWDECSYDDDKHVPLFVANAVANAKWLISGTPKLFGLEQVCKIAAAFGVHVARPEPRMMPGLPAVTKGPELDSMSKSEEFHVFSSRIKSVALAHERHSQAQKFVAAYFRANALDTEVNIEFEEHVQSVGMTASNWVRYHLLNQTIIDAGYDYTILPAHARDVVVLKGSDLVGKDGPAAAKMLLGLLASGLGENGNSINALEMDLAGRVELLSDQMKLLWDKTMWLWRWISKLRPEDDPESRESKVSTPVQDTLTRVEILCDSLDKALLGGGNFEEFGGREMFQHEAAVVASLWGKPQNPGNLNLHIAYLQAYWGMHFQPGWMTQYNENKAQYTWLDFFNVEDSTVDRLTGKQLRLLAEDICWLRYKIVPGALSLENQHEGQHQNHLPVDFLPDALDPGSNTGSRNIPADIGQLVADDKRVLDGLAEDQLKQFIRHCAGFKPPAQTWQAAKDSFTFATDAKKTVKLNLEERLTERNLKFSSSTSVDKLKEALWRHESGLSRCEHYRDGRAPPDRHRDLELATWCGGTAVKQMETANEELKRTMVHLSKTVEDLRATRLEGNFVPAYSSLAHARDKDLFLRAKPCGSCHQPLWSAASSFLVVACGHFLCGQCKSAAGFYCPVQDCPAFIRKRPVLRCSQVPEIPSVEPRGKARCVADLIKDNIPSEDFVVVFAQYRPLINGLAKAFEDAGLEYLNLAAMNDESISKKLEEFKLGRAGQVLLLDMDSETSAGSNLTIATHVIFATPYVHPDEEHQARTVRQARGRCIRTGQTKKVHVYHFMVSGTVEEETLRKFGKDSPAVRSFFENSDSIPWWMEEEEEEEEETRKSEATPIEEEN